MSNKMKIAVVTSGYLPIPDVLGGAVEALEMVLIEQNETINNFEFTFYSCWNPRAAECASKLANTTVEYIKPTKIIKITDMVIHKLAGHIKRIKKTASFAHVAQRLHFLRKTALLLSQRDYDLVVFENHATQFLILRWYSNAKRYSGKVIFHLHNEVTNDFGCRKELISSVKFICVSDFIRRSLCNRFPEIDQNKCCVLLNCSDLAPEFEKITKDDVKNFRMKLGFSDDDIVVLFAGRITPEKGLDRLIEAIGRIDSAHVKLLVAGSVLFGSSVGSEYELQVRTMAEQFGSKIVQLGYVKHVDMPLVYRSADIYCSPSMWDDPAPLVNIEAMLSGKPIISTVSGGIPEYVDQDCAYLFRRDSNLSINIAHAIEELEHSPALRDRMGEAGVRKSKQYTPEKYYKDFMSIIESL